MAKYTKYEWLKIIMFWSFVIAIIWFILDSIIAIAGVAQGAVIALFVLALIFTFISASIWIYVKIKKTTRKVARN
ncbi:hypothetical protein [[Mycoplasma] testudinis]|uniref:hypothetical protein n=1 Tax=[Mycoplasma] testudinis TaxID=33924 RepID=UPI000480FC5F|nr:hypothetical protein [[Mycoplasma] testudinis]